VKDQTLWFEGNPRLLSEPLASVVGTREPSREGVLRTKRLTTLLVQNGFCVVSGLAQGIDGVAHQTALDLGGLTIAVMGTSIEQCYPKEHLELKQEIIRHGLVLSQFPPEQPTSRRNFPQRNVLMAALSSVSFIVEAGIDSGTKHQVKAAIEMGKPIGFLASLVSQEYDWVKKAIETGLGIVIETDEDAVAFLRCVKEFEYKTREQSDEKQTDREPEQSHAKHTELDFGFTHQGSHTSKADSTHEPDFIIMQYTKQHHSTARDDAPPIAESGFATTNSDNHPSTVSKEPSVPSEPAFATTNAVGGHSTGGNEETRSYEPAFAAAKPSQEHSTAGEHLPRPSRSSQKKSESPRAGIFVRFMKRFFGR
jgi:DNA processing protein